MPRFISKDGVWHPADPKTKKALGQAGLETIGAPAEGEASKHAAPAAIEGEDLEESMPKKKKKMLKKVKKKRGIKSRKIRRKIL